jgi:hypothetical protein
MKTQTLLRTSSALFVGSLLAAAAIAGPGPEYWNKVRPTPAAKPVPVKMDEHPAGQCNGCKTTPNWVMGDRGPAGKRVGLRVVGYSHACTGCTGTITTANGQAKSDMKHAAGCATLVCCK